MAPEYNGICFFYNYTEACWRSLLFLLKRKPNCLNTNVMGIMITARQPRRVEAHCTPRFSNICLEKRGNPAATAERSMMFAATAEAALEQTSQFRITSKQIVGNSQWQIRVYQIVEARQEDT